MTPSIFQVLKDHCVELMSVEVPTDASEILEPESEAPTVVASAAKTFWGVATDYSSAPKPDSSVSNIRKIETEKPSNSADLTSMLAILVLIFSIIMGLVYYFMGSV